MNNKNVLVVAAHADDETLGCGATIARHCSKGDAVHVIFMTDGVSSRSHDEALADKRCADSLAALKALGVTDAPTQCDFPDNEMDTIPLLDVVTVIEKTIVSTQAEIIYTHHAGDLNIDHQTVHRAVMTACRPQPASKVTQIYSFEVPSATCWSGPSMGKHFIPQYHIDVSAHWDQKLQALKAYGDEMRPSPHARSLEGVTALAQYRGHQVGVPLAEAFVVERLIASD